MDVSEPGPGGQRVYIVILNWNGWRDTLTCLASVFGLERQPFVAVVRDNAPADDSLGRIQAWAQGDVVICADVLEHLANPWAVVGQLQRLLRPGAVLLASVPNVHEARTWYKVFWLGDFAYTDAGVLDRTHLRLFCRRNILALLTIAGGQIARVSSGLVGRTNWRARLDRLSFGLLQEFLVTQYLVRVRRP